MHSEPEATSAVEATVTMTLSRAILRGAQMNPTQAFRTVYDCKTGGTCAIGAACEALGILDKATNSYTAPRPESWRRVAMAWTECPHCGAFDYGQQIMTHLNDHHTWSRELIGLWVAIQERRLA